MCLKTGLVYKIGWVCREEVCARIWPAVSNMGLYNITCEIMICLFYPGLKDIIPHQLLENNWDMFLVLTLIKCETGNTGNTGNTMIDKYKPCILCIIYTWPSLWDNNFIIKYSDLGSRFKKKKVFSKCGNNLHGWLSRNWTANFHNIGFKACFAAINQ